MADNGRKNAENSGTPFAIIPDLRVLDIVTNARQLRLVIALRSYPSSRRNEVWASWEDLGDRARLIPPNGSTRHVRLIADELRDLGLLRWENRGGRKTNLYTLLGALAGGPTLHQSGAPTDDLSLHQSGAPTLHQSGAPSHLLRQRDETTTTVVGVVASIGQGTPTQGGTEAEAGAGTEREPGAGAGTEQVTGAGAGQPDRPEAASGQQAEADPDLLDDATLDPDLCEDEFTYVLDIQPNKGKGDRALLGDGREVMIFNPARARALRHHIGEPVRVRTSKSGRFDVLESFEKPDPPDRRRSSRLSKLEQRVDEFAGGFEVREHFEALLLAAEQDDPLVSDLRDRIVGWAQTQAEDRRYRRKSFGHVVELLRRLGVPEDDIPTELPVEPVEPVKVEGAIFHTATGDPVTAPQLDSIADEIGGAKEQIPPRPPERPHRPRPREPVEPAHESKSSVNLDALLEVSGIGVAEEEPTPPGLPESTARFDALVASSGLGGAKEEPPSEPVQVEPANDTSSDHTSPESKSPESTADLDALFATSGLGVEEEQIPTPPPEPVEAEPANDTPSDHTGPAPPMISAEAFWALMPDEVIP